MSIRGWLGDNTVTGLRERNLDIPSPLYNLISIFNLSASSGSILIRLGLYYRTEFGLQYKLECTLIKPIYAKLLRVELVECITVNRPGRLVARSHPRES